MDRSGSITLGFDTLGLVVWPGLFGILPAAIWLGSLLYPLSFVVSPNALGACACVLMLAVLVGPSVTAGLVQRARQPRPARIAWDDDELVEWDGDSIRTTIPWSRLEVGWQKRSIGVARSTSALQLRDRETRALIHAWVIEPPGVQPVRRRIYTSIGEMTKLVRAIEVHDPEFADARATSDTVGAPDWSLAVDRWRPWWLVRVGRLGYVGAVVAPVLAVAPPPTSGIGAPAMVAGVIAVCSSALLVLRAEPARREWISTHSKAARVETMLRLGFAVMVVYSTLVSALFSRAHP